MNLIGCICFSVVAAMLAFRWHKAILNVFLPEADRFQDHKYRYKSDGSVEEVKENRK